MNDPIQTIIGLEGDQSGQELPKDSLRVFDAALWKVPLTFEHYYLSFANRTATNRAVIKYAADCIAKTRMGLNAATKSFADKVIERVSAELHIWETQPESKPGD